MSTGIVLQDNVVSEFNSVKLTHKYKYIIYRITEDLKEVAVEKMAGKDRKYDDFIADLPKDEARYAVYDLEYDTKDGKRTKLVFILWTPDNCNIKSKMLYSATKATMKNALVGISAEIQATDAQEISMEAIMEKVLSVSK